MRSFTVLFCFIFLSHYGYSQVGLYDLGTIQQIEINFTQANWDYQLDTAKLGSENYIMAASVTINGSTYDSVGVKYKGNSSYDSTYSKNPLHIALDEFKNQAYQGFTDLKLGNGYADPSQIREVLAYSELRNYMDCPRANFAQVFINGTYYGVYSNAESINKDFCSEHFSSSSNTFIKCNPIVLPGPTTKSNLKFKPGLDSTAYFNFYEIKSDFGWNELVELCDSVSNHPNSIDSKMDLDRLIWMLAYNNVLVNLDSYSGVFCQNYYLYKDNTQHFNPIIWDLNMAFGGFPFAGTGATGMGSLTIPSLQQLSLNLHAGDSNWPLITAVLSDASYKRMYIAHMRTMVNELFANNSYVTEATQLQSLIDTAVQTDSNGFFSYAQFQNGMTTNYSIGSYSVPGISNLMNARVAYLQATPEFLAVPPSIAPIAVSNTSPSLNSTVNFTVLVTNAASSGVFLGYRFLEDEKFNRIPMFDDGAHNDGAAGDNVFGASVTMINVRLQYYLYAENSVAGIFSPERAEHEFYILLCQLQTPAIGQLVINEFLAGNASDTTDENGDYSDWIELYNLSSDTLSLYGLYLSDSYTNPQKFAFPINTLVYPNGYFMVWADDKAGNGSIVHSNFKLSVNGERIILSAANLMVLDSLTFGPQSMDISMGRCPNGTGQFSALFPATFNASNCALGIEKHFEENVIIKAFPNPANNYLTITNSKVEVNNVLIIENALGQEYYTENAASTNVIDVSTWPNGMYFLHIGSISKKILVNK